MTYFYNEQDLAKIKKEKDINLILMISFYSLAVILLVLFIILSDYHTRTLFSVIASVCCSTLIIFGIYFTYKFSYLRRVFNEYETLLNAKNDVLNCEILECSKFITTLPDRSRG